MATSEQSATRLVAVDDLGDSQVAVVDDTPHGALAPHRPRSAPGLLRSLALTVALATLAAISLPSDSFAANRVYWSNETGHKISFANLDGSGGADVPIPAPLVNAPQGVAIDAAAGKIYWANSGSNTIASANLDGTGAAPINVSGALVSSPYGIAIDPIAKKLYWANAPLVGDSISFSNLDGSAGGAVITAGATALSNPLGAAVDPGAGQVYWANYGANKISYANLNGTGGNDVIPGVATVASPIGVAVLASAARIYWANGSGSIAFANLNGSGGANLNTTGAPVGNASGVAIDPAASRVYWGASPGMIGFADINQNGGASLPTNGASGNSASFPALLEVPAGAGNPTISGGSAFGSKLSCSTGTWAPDLLSSFLYRAPQSFAYSWSRNGSAIAGATTSSHTTTAGGDYRCTVTASNAAGSTPQTSDPHAVKPSKPSNIFKFGKLRRNTRRGTATLAVDVPGPGQLGLTGKGVARVRTLGAVPAKAVKKAGKVTLRIKARGKAKRRLNRRGSLKTKLKVTFTPSGGSANSKTKTVKLVKKRA